MKKILITSTLFILLGNTIFAQASKNVTLKIDADTKTAIKNDNSLNSAEKEKFILRIETFVETAKKDDTKAMEIFESEYKRIANNYLRVTGKSLPDLQPLKDNN